jgi:hypothetical protein
MMRKGILLSAFLLLSFLGMGQDKKIWTLKECIDLACKITLT